MDRRSNNEFRNQYYISGNNSKAPYHNSDAVVFFIFFK